MSDADKYRILPEQTVYDEADYAAWRVERDRRQAEYIAASLEDFTAHTESGIYDVSKIWNRVVAARAALLAHMEAHS